MCFHAVRDPVHIFLVNEVYGELISHSNVKTTENYDDGSMAGMVG